MAAVLFCLFSVAPANAATLESVGPLVPMDVEEVYVNDSGQLVAVITAGDKTIERVLNLSVASTERDLMALAETCAILDLRLESIFLDVLGLQVETSDICLQIWAEEGALLGDLLCNIAGLLDGGFSLDEILGNLTEEELTSLLGGLQALLDEALAAITSPANANVIDVVQNTALGTLGSHGGGQGGGQPATQILLLEVGPLELDLLGLNVLLDDCEGGPVVVEIRAQPGRGNLLGNLLTGLSQLLDGNANDNAVASLLRRVSNAIDGLLGL